MEEPRVDPRIRRTRAALRDALAALLEKRGFDEITLHQIAEAAGLNRATIYKHHPDKFALLDAWIGDDLRDRLSVATVSCESTCEAKLAAVVSATCECVSWVRTLGRHDDRLLRPIAEARIGSLVSHTIEFALRERILHAVSKSALAGPMASAAICAAAAVWADGKNTSSRALGAHVAKTIAGLSMLVVPGSQMPRLTRALTFT